MPTDADPAADHAWIRELVARRPRAPETPRARVHRHDHGGPGGERACWSATATSCDALGCEVEAPAPARVGEQVLVELEDERVGESVALVGHVRSCTVAPPWRVGIRFDAAGMLTALRFF